MNTPRISFQLRRLGSLLGLVFIVSNVQSAYAGPGADYWRRSAKAEQPQASDSVSPECKMTCPDSRTVAITERRNAWPNGRGPWQEVSIGTKQVCDSCGGTSTVMKPSLPNGRGPMQSVTVASTHVCRESVSSKQG